MTLNHLLMIGSHFQHFVPSFMRKVVCLFSSLTDSGFLCVQTCRGRGEVPRLAAASAADVSGQTDHQQRNGAGEDEES